MASNGRDEDSREAGVIVWTDIALMKDGVPMDATRSRDELTHRSMNTHVPAPRSTGGQALAASVDYPPGQRVWVRLGDSPRLCPRCRSAATQRSRRRGVLEALLTFVPVRPFRCMDCDRRFYGSLFKFHSVGTQSPVTRGPRVGPRRSP